MSRRQTIASIALASLWIAPAVAQQSEEDLAKQLADPVAALVSVPFQLNHDTDIGPAGIGFRLVATLLFPR